MKIKEKLFIDTFESLEKKGIKVKIALSGTDPMIDKLRKSMKLEIKQVDIDAKFFIIDRKEVLFYLTKDANKDDQAIWLNSDFFSEAFADLFEIALKA